MTKDEIDIKIVIERFEKNSEKINEEIKKFVSRLKQLCEVKNYNLIKLKMLMPNEKENKNR